MTSTASQESDDESDMTFHHNLEKVSQLEMDVRELTNENSELFVLLQSEQRKTKLLQNELELGSETSPKQGKVEDVVRETSEEFLQDVVLMLKEKLESKDNECEELEDKLSVMNQELASQGEDLDRRSLEFEHQMRHLHELLAQERDLNCLLSEESDQIVHELETQMQAKDEINAELKVIQDETSERMEFIEGECRFYQTMLHDTETRLHSITCEPAIDVDSVSCQVSESELRTLGEIEKESCENKTFNDVFTALWGKGDIEMNGVGNATRYKMSIFNLIQNGFRNLRGHIVT